MIDQIIFIFVYKDVTTYSGKNKSLELFSAAQGHSYSCTAETVYMGNGVSLDLSNYRLQAFNIKNDQFGARKYRVMTLQYLKAPHPCSEWHSTSSYVAIWTILFAFFMHRIAYVLVTLILTSKTCSRHILLILEQHFNPTPKPNPNIRGKW